MLIEIKKAFTRTEFFVAVILGVIVAILGLMDSLYGYTLRFDRTYSAFQASLSMGGLMAELFSVFILPLITVIPYADTYATEQKYGVHMIELTKSKRPKYFISKAIIVWSVAIIVVFIPYALNQIFCLIAYPSERVVNLYRDNIYNNSDFLEVKLNPNMVLQFNHPLLRNILHTLYACFYGGAIALSAYVATLHVSKSKKAFVIVLPVAVTFAACLLGLMLFGDDGVLPSGITANKGIHITTYVPMIIIISIIYIGCILGVLDKSYRRKDII